MPRWVRPEVYPLMAAMTFVTTMCVFQLTRNVFMNPDVRFLRTRPPEVMPAVNSFFSDTK
ncbi:NADH-ubiquinone reductase complex 1 MLRQ subunit [Cynara cardunculus var. scolymus]|uniref:NADH-ubiquinone reductase complex 1 MLRQ subunit n=1 Tax=Cynara cardunculus var. scolymus TaxID=59895 RepID=A0A103XKU4_CYNCS|nr:NADH-ubiquinone reductase complex 1 MLRQ subunit [Cynara cardunculus var. scolymus]